MMLRRPFLGGIALTALLAQPALAADKTDDWRSALPEQFGYSSQAWHTAADHVKDARWRYCMSVVKDNHLIFDRAYVGQPNDRYWGFSVTKTVAAVLVGIAEYQGLLALDDRVIDWLGSVPSDMNPAATIRDVLGQVSHSDPLGSDFSYNSGARINTLGEILGRAAKQPAVDYAARALFAPLGMQYTTWAADSDGNLNIGSGITSSCRDLARVGQLLLDDGVWRGTRLLGADYLEALKQPSYPAANSNYGYLTWLNWSDGPWQRPLSSGTGPMVVGAPANAYFATGFFGQLIINIPDENVVVTTMGLTLQLETLNTLQDVWDAIAPALNSGKDIR